MSTALKGAAIAALTSLAIAAPAAAKTYEVNKRADHTPNGCKKKDCTLREAVIAANAHGGADRIVLPERKTYNLARENATPPGEDEAATGDLDVTDRAQIVHPGKGRAKIDANAIDRVFDLFATTRFKRVGIRGGETTSGGDDFGGGIRSIADVTLQRSSVTANTAVDDGGGIGYDVGDASLTLTRSTVKNNFSGNDGGGVSFNEAGSGQFVVSRSKFVGNDSEDWGGGFITAVTATITKSTFSGNVALSGNGGGGSIEEPSGNVVRDTTFSGNSAINGGGLSVSSDSDATLTNVTLANNAVSNEGGDAQGGGLLVDGGTASLNATTIVRNAADEGGGLLSDTDGVVEVANSILALNAALTGPDCFVTSEPLVSAGHNLIGDDTDCDAFDATGDFVSSNPKLGQLKNNGGPTQTVALKKGSPAINKAANSAPNKDQRGQKRGKKPDVGAYERVKKKKRR